MVLLSSLPSHARAADDKDLELKLLPAAKAGDVEAQYQLGVIYTSSSSMKMTRPRDAERWLRSAAAQDHLGAMLLLVELYLIHPELASDPGEVATWLERAAALGHTRSAVMLGTMLWNGGRGLNVDRARGFRLLRTGALRGDEAAALFLAGHTLDGVGIKRDPAKARQVLEFAGANGILRARQELKVLSENARSLSPPAEIFHRLEKQAAKGDAEAMLLLGISQQNDPDFLAQHEDTTMAERRTRARAWFEQASALGNPEAATRLGIMYANGQGVTIDSAKAAALFEHAAASNALSQLNLAVLILDGKVPRTDPARAISLLAAASAQNPNAAFELGMIYYEGRLHPRDVPQAVTLFERAARQGQQPALVNLGVIAINGEAGPVDPAAALKWWTIAQLGGSEPAAGLLRRASHRFTAAQHAALPEQLRQWQDSILQDRAAKFPELILE
jgi:TPR repeat protein